MMRRLVAAAVLLIPVLARAAGKAGDWRVSDTVLTGAGRYSADDFETGVYLPTGKWDLSGRVKTFQYLDAVPGAETEYAGRVERNLPHVSIAGRLGAAPPNSGRLAYRLASGEVLLTFYGLQIGPKDAAKSQTVAEDTATAAAQAHLDTTWVTRFRTLYTNTDFHRSATAPNGHDFIVVQNSWQFALSETWRERATFAFHVGGEKYGPTVHGFDPSFRHWNVDYEGAPIAIAGYPNNHVGADWSQKLGADWSVRAGFTRLNMLFGQIHLLAGGGVSWRPRGGPWEARAGWYHHRVLGVSTREVWAFGGGYRW
jgi:hypothetical protein